MTENSKKSAADYSPVIGFVVSYFFFHIFTWQEATHFVFSVIVSLIIFMIELKLIREEYQLNRKNLKQSHFITGLLSVMAMIVFIVGVLNWYRIIDYAWRMALLLISVVIYVAVMFRGINILIFIKQVSEKKKSNR